MKYTVAVKRLKHEEIIFHALGLSGSDLKQVRSLEEEEEATQFTPFLFPGQRNDVSNVSVNV